MVQERVTGYKRRDGTIVGGYSRRKRPKGKKRLRRKINPKPRIQVVDEYGVFR